MPSFSRSMARSRRKSIYDRGMEGPEKSERARGRAEQAVGVGDRRLRSPTLCRHCRPSHRLPRFSFAAASPPAFHPWDDCTRASRLVSAGSREKQCDGNMKISPSWRGLERGHREEAAAEESTSSSRQDEIAPASNDRLRGPSDPPLERPRALSCSYRRIGARTRHRASLWSELAGRRRQKREREKVRQVRRGEEGELEIVFFLRCFSIFFPSLPRGLRKKQGEKSMPN